MGKHKPPSQVRYERSHPTISFRLDKEMKERLKKVLKGQSFASFIKEALGEREREERTLEEAREEGYYEGYEEAMETFGVYTNCAICGGEILIKSEEEKKNLEKLMRERGWSHINCMRRREYRW